jgi:trehalose synthase
MLQRVDVASIPLHRYDAVFSADEIQKLHELAAPLRGLRVAHINATAYGGGVSELLHSLVPFCRALGIDAEWHIIPGDDSFFRVTKAFHNALQGMELELAEDAKDTYLSYNQKFADLLGPDYDIVMIHDPQPAAMRSLHGRGKGKWVWRCHIDTSHPNPQVLGFLRPFLAEYDALVFTMEEFVPPDLRNEKYAIIPPSIDPLSPKNMPLTKDMSRQIIEWTGLQLDRLLITQVSRFDPWKDPLGVIKVYKRVRQEVPGTQLALLGQMALDDPQGWDMYREINEETKDDSDIHVRTNFTGIGNFEVNAFQSCSDVVLQKSIREGFGLVVSETLWKGTAMVSGRAGGIPMQMPEGVGGFLVGSDDEYVEKTVELLRDHRKAQELGAKGREHVRKHFLINRHVADHLQLWASLIQGRGVR